MPEAYYVIPMTSPPYSWANRQKPLYLDAIQCNWTGHNVDALGVYVCKVNTTEAKHTQLAAQAGVYQLPRQYTWNTVISTMQAAARNYIRNNICTPFGIPYDSTETLGELCMRVINSGLFDLGSTPLDTQFQNLTTAQQNKIDVLCRKWGISYAPTDTVKQLSNRGGRLWWPGDQLVVPEG